MPRSFGAWWIMTSNILVRDFKGVLRHTRWVDASADVQVRRAMGRLGLVERGAGPDVVVYAARDQFRLPDAFDAKVFAIGRDLGRPTAPRCSKFCLADPCLYAREVSD